MLEQDNELTKITYQLFVQSMETHYSEIIKFLAIVLPSLTGFFYMLHLYESAIANDPLTWTFVFVTIAVVGIQTWGAIYALAMSYRFRYLQATVRAIEEAGNVHRYMPASFRPKPITRLGARLAFSISPLILQVHVHFFIVSIIVVTAASCVAVCAPWRGLIGALGVAAILVIYTVGVGVVPKKYNALLKSMDEQASRDGRADQPH